MGGLTQGERPAITPPQIVAMIIAGIPLAAQFLHGFGIYDLSAESQEALNNAVTWAGVFAGSLIGGDAVLRTGRNLRKGKVEAVLAEGGEAHTLEIVQDSMLVPASKPVVATGGTLQGGDPSTKTGFEEPPKL
jgi:hypothetical protein